MAPLSVLGHSQECNSLMLGVLSHNVEVFDGELPSREKMGAQGTSVDRTDAQLVGANPAGSS